MVKRCCVCKTLFKKGDQKSFHRIPKKLERRKRWMLALGNIAVNGNTFICSDHFAESDFVLKPSGIKYLREVAVPTIVSISTSTVSAVRSIEERNICERSDNGEKENISPVENEPEQSVQEIKSISFEKPASELSSSSSTITTTSSSPPSKDVPETYSFGNTSRSPSVCSSSTLTASEGGSEVDVDLPCHEQTTTLSKKPYPRKFEECHTSDMESPTPTRQAWNICIKKIQLQRKKIRYLQQAKCRLRARISNLTSVLTYLKKKHSIT